MDGWMDRWIDSWVDRDIQACMCVYAYIYIIYIYIYNIIYISLSRHYLKPSTRDNDMKHVPDMPHGLNLAIRTHQL